MEPVNVCGPTRLYSHEEDIASVFGKGTASTSTRNINNTPRTSGRDIGPTQRPGRPPTVPSDTRGVAAVKGRDKASGVEVEAFSASIQAGEQNEAQVGLLRLGVSNDAGNRSATITAFAAEGHLGSPNPDGSSGINGGVGAVLVGVEGTFEASGWSVTVGLFCWRGCRSKRRRARC